MLPDYPVSQNRTRRIQWDGTWGGISDLANPGGIDDQDVTSRQELSWKSESQRHEEAWRYFKIFSIPFPEKLLMSHRSAIHREEDIQNKKSRA